MKIERIIFVFKKNEDEVLTKIIANNLNLNLLNELFKSKEDDPNFYSPDKIEKKQYDILITYLPELKNYPCENFELYLEAVSV